MAKTNNAVRLRRELMIRVAKLHAEGRLCEEIDRIPLEMAPRDSEAIRCCVYKDRAVLKYRAMSLLGYGVEDEADELTTLGRYAAEAVSRRRAPAPEPSVLDIACDSCTRGSHLVTDACRGCVARPCTTSCPKGAVSVINGRAVIDQERCVNCGLCAKECAYHAIIYRPVPCEQACPVDAIEKDDRGRIRIDRETCISCGRCITACPFSAVMDRSQMVDTLSALARPGKVIAAVAPAGIGQFSAPFERLVAACKRLGFDEVWEVAAAAEEVARRETAELSERLEEGSPFMTSSCCPAWVESVRRHLPDLTPFVSHTPSPMVLAGEEIRKENRAATVVFVGPCLAKKREAAESGVVDYVISFEELGAMFVANEIDVQECPEERATRVGAALGRGFPVAGGVGRAIRRQFPGEDSIATALIDGLDAQTIKSVRRIGAQPDNESLRPEGAQFLEVMACPGGCVAGPLAYGSAKAALREIKKQGVPVG